MRLNINLTEGKVKRNVFFTSDFHLFHDNVIKFDNRPFTNVLDMHIAIVEGWNSVVKPEDIVIYLGDLSFAKAKDKPLVEVLVSQLNGTIHFVMGNHDKWEEINKMKRFASVQDYLEVRITHFATVGVGSQALTKEELAFSCMHYPMYTWNKSHRGSYHVHGHEHGNLHHGMTAEYYKNRRAIDAGCMLNDYRPISYLDVIDKLKDIKLQTLEPRNL